MYRLAYRHSPNRQLPRVFISNRDKTQTLLTYHCRNKQILQENLKYLHEIEKANHFKLTELHDILDQPNYVIIIGSNQWQACTFRLSFYSKLFRRLDSKVLDSQEEFWSHYSEELSTSEHTSFLRKICYSGKLREINKNLNSYMEEHKIIKQTMETVA